MLWLDVIGFMINPLLNKAISPEGTAGKRIEMERSQIKKRMTRENLDRLFPPDRSDYFFEALYGDISEGAYDIQLEFKSYYKDKFELEFHLKQRPDKCMACHLTYGLPEVFERHPIINIKGLTKKLEELFEGTIRCTSWELGYTAEVSNQLHVIPLIVEIEETLSER